MRVAHLNRQHHQRTHHGRRRLGQTEAVRNDDGAQQRRHGVQLKPQHHCDVAGRHVAQHAAADGHESAVRHRAPTAPSPPSRAGRCPQRRTARARLRGKTAPPPRRVPQAAFRRSRAGRPRSRRSCGGPAATPGGRPPSSRARQPAAETRDEAEDKHAERVAAQPSPRRRRRRRRRRFKPWHLWTVRAYVFIRLQDRCRTRVGGGSRVLGCGFWAGGRIRTDGLPITSRLRYRAAPRRPGVRAQA